MNDIFQQRVVSALETNTAALMDNTRALDATRSQDGDDNRMVNAVQLAKALGLSHQTTWHKLISGEFPSEGSGRNRRANIAQIKALRKNEVANF